MNSYLFPGLELGPIAIRRILAALPAASLDAKVDPNRFSPREIIAHLADWEPILLDRMRTSRDTPGETLYGHDEAVMAEQNGYRESDPMAQAELYLRRRGETLAWLKTLAADDWDKVGVHEERGPMTVRDQANMMLGHELYHIEQLTSYLS